MSDNIKINSNTFSLNKESSEFKALEEIVTKIATDNKIEGVDSIHISLSKDDGLIGFKKKAAADVEGTAAPTADATQPALTQPEKSEQVAPLESK